ncbi:hypothetical protein KY314_04775 [Candidatus Woesearchaeota archaeon]|nr:hypothetical protein [Candidatus Woesearchaeota archaeon]
MREFKSKDEIDKFLEKYPEKMTPEQLVEIGMYESIEERDYWFDRCRKFLNDNGTKTTKATNRDKVKKSLVKDYFVLGNGLREI